MPTLVRISIAPVKGLRLLHPSAVDLAGRGIPTDRRFLLSREPGDLLDATDRPQLLRVVPDYDPAAEHLRLTFPDGAIVEGAADRLGDAIVLDVYGRATRGHRVLGPFDGALSRFVGAPVRLLRAPDGTAQDAHDLTVVSSSSVRELGAGAGREDLDARRFRINLEIDGTAPYEEDTWHGREVRIGVASIRVLSQIPRCVVTTLDPDSGDKDFNTLTQLARTRKRIGGRGGLPFGMYAEVVETGRISVGDLVEPVSSKVAGRATAAGP